MEEAKKMKCYKRLIYKQFFQVSGLCGPRFLSYLPKRFTHLCTALYGDAILAVVTLHTFALGKLDLLTVSLGKLNFSSVTDFSLVSGLCRPRFLSYLPKRFTHLCSALYGDAILAVVTLHTFALGKLDLLTVSLGKLNFSSVTDFSLGNLPRGNFIVWSLDMSRELDSYPKARARANSNPKVTNQWTLVGGCVDDRTGNL